MLRIEKKAMCSQQASEYLIPRARRYGMYIYIYFSGGFHVLGSFYKTGMFELGIFFYDEENTNKTIITSIFISYISACLDIF